MLNPLTAMPIFSRKKLLGNFIAPLVFMLERKILSHFFFSQLIKLFHRTMEKKKSKIQLNNYELFLLKPLTLTLL